MKNQKKIFPYNSLLIKSFSKDDKLNDKEKISYHYTSPEAFLSIIRNKSIRFTDIRYLNDKSEGIYFVKLLLDFLDEHKGEYGNFELAVTELLKNNDYSKIRNLETTEIIYADIPKMSYTPDRVFVFCTCMEPDALNMWNYYVNNGSYQGYNIGFRINELLKSFDTPSAGECDAFSVFYGKVMYSEKDQFAEIQQLAQGIQKGIDIKALEGEKEEGIAFAELWIRNYINSRGAFFKHPKFKAEEEFRIVIEINNERIPRREGDANKYFGEYNKKMIEGFCTKKGLIVPYLNIAFSDQAIYRITIAPMMEYEIAKSSIKELLNSSNMQKIKVYKSTIPIRF